MGPNFKKVIVHKVSKVYKYEFGLLLTCNSKEQTGNDDEKEVEGTRSRNASQL